MASFMDLIFPATPSLFLTGMTVIGLTGSAMGGISEATGKNIRYSKFWNSGAGEIGRETQISSRAGMLLVYSPALIAALASFAVPGFAGAGRSRLVSTVLSLHFFKRVFEVLFIHQYSGQMILNSAITISVSYCINTVTLLYAQYLTHGTPEPPIDLKSAGILLFLIGITGNFYHHYLLSKLRKKDEKAGYKIPSGGLFSLVVCPHYLFEIIGFLGIALVSQTLYSFSWFSGTLFYLMGRSYATRKWYLSKFENFPGDVKALIPCLLVKEFYLIRGF